MKYSLLSLSIALASLSGVQAQSFEKSEFEASSGDTIRYALLEPSDLRSGEKYPLVITLHGIGGRGVSNWTPRCYANAVLSQSKMRKKYPCFLLAPTTEKGETWWSSEGLKGKARMPDVIDLIGQLVDDLPIDPDRIYVTGQSMGGFGTFAAIVESPDLFAAAAPVCGGHEPKNAKAIADIPIWIFHGARDTTIPAERSIEMVEAIERAGGDPKYTEFPDAGHNAWTPAYDDEKLWEWMFEQRKADR